MNSIAIIGAHKLFNCGIRSLISNFFPNYTILFEAKDVAELTQNLAIKGKPEIILIDFNMAGKEAYETTALIRKNYPAINIICLSIEEREEDVLNLINLTVKGFLLKDTEAESFKSALNTVASGGYFYPPFITEFLVNSISKKRTSSFDQVKLNKREIEFMQLSASELTYKEIADRLCVSARTVDGYRDHLFDKLNVKSRVGLVLYGIKNRLLQF
ncbi:LuxR C-terminal-related transcriptional regulator [Rubrolithibacter danxiaensis]|uniref:LuxR C-terminal-related transcriptional regulator n=1 Tax=Rubrolithibacter danxiaensis TaxID=3390805 RepID=UPI003BF79212